MGNTDLQKNVGWCYFFALKFVYVGDFLLFVHILPAKLFYILFPQNLYNTEKSSTFVSEIKISITMAKKKKQVDITKVIFRKYKDGSVIALMPEEEWCEGCITSYLHIGQHAGADYDHVMRNTTAATQEEYAHLYNELKRVGYLHLQVIKRKPRKG